MTGYIMPVRTKAGSVKSKAVFLTEFSKIRKKRKKREENIGNQREDTQTETAAEAERFGL